MNGNDTLIAALLRADELLADPRAGGANTAAARAAIKEALEAAGPPTATDAAPNPAEPHHVQIGVGDTGGDVKDVAP